MLWLHKCPYAEQKLKLGTQCYIVWVKKTTAELNKKIENSNFYGKNNNRPVILSFKWFFML